MRITSLSAWLAACTFASSACAFSALSKKQQRISGSTLARSIQTTGGYVENNNNNRQNVALNVASADTVPIAQMGRGIGGRLEESFAAAKANGEAAFVAFITAGYPAKEGVCVCVCVRACVSVDLVDKLANNKD